MSEYGPGDLLIINGGRYGKYRLVAVDSLKEVATAVEWEDIVLRSLELVAPDLAALVAQEGRDNESMRRRWISAAHLFVHGNVFEQEPGFSYMVESETRPGAYYSVTCSLGAVRYRCTCEDFKWSSQSGRALWPRVGGFTVCKHALACELYHRFHYDKEVVQDAVA